MDINKQVIISELIYDILLVVLDANQFRMVIALFYGRQQTFPFDFPAFSLTNYFLYYALSGF